MHWTVIRLTRNSPRGCMGDLVEVPEPEACRMVRDGRAEPAGAVAVLWEPRLGQDRAVDMFNLPDTRSC